jgi:hypothetical protein
MALSTASPQIKSRSPDVINLRMTICSLSLHSHTVLLSIYYSAVAIALMISRRARRRALATTDTATLQDYTSSPCHRAIAHHRPHSRVTAVARSRVGVNAIACCGSRALQRAGRTLAGSSSTARWFRGPLGVKITAPSCNAAGNLQYRPRARCAIELTSVSRSVSGRDRRRAGVRQGDSSRNARSFVNATPRHATRGSGCVGRSADRSSEITSTKIR